MVMTRSDRRLSDIEEFHYSPEFDPFEDDYATVRAVIGYHAPRETSADVLTARRDAMRDYDA